MFIGAIMGTSIQSENWGIWLNQTNEKTKNVLSLQKGKTLMRSLSIYIYYMYTLIIAICKESKLPQKVKSNIITVVVFFLIKVSERK